MLTMTRGQMHILASTARERWIDELLAHVLEHFPAVAAQEGEGRTRHRIEQIMDEAQASGLESRADCCKYLNLSYIMGDGFLRRRGMEWATEMLAARSPDAMANLYEIVIRQLEIRGK